MAGGFSQNFYLHCGDRAITGAPCRRGRAARCRAPLPLRRQGGTRAVPPSPHSPTRAPLLSPHRRTLTLILCYRAPAAAAIAAPAVDASHPEASRRHQKLLLNLLLLPDQALLVGKPWTGGIGRSSPAPTAAIRASSHRRRPSPAFSDHGNVLVVSSSLPCASSLSSSRSGPRCHRRPPLPWSPATLR